MAHYDLDSDESLHADPSPMNTGDTFVLNGTTYTVEYKCVAGPFMVFTQETTPLFVVSHAWGGVRRYQTATFNGDWEGCCPLATTLIDALAYELLRLDEIDAERCREAADTAR